MDGSEETDEAVGTSHPVASPSTRAPPSSNVDGATNVIKTVQLYSNIRGRSQHGRPSSNEEPLDHLVPTRASSPIVRRASTVFQSQTQDDDGDDGAVDGGDDDGGGEVRTANLGDGADGADGGEDEPDDESAEGEEDVPPPPPPLRDPPTLLPILQIEERWKNMTNWVAKKIYNVDEPRDFQHEGIHHVTHNNNTVLVVNHRTADGKSLIPQAAGVIRRGVILYLVPLVGLGSDQVEKALKEQFNVQPCHIDEHRNAAARELRQRLYLLDDDEIKNVIIPVFVGPKMITNKFWRPVFEWLADKGYISLFCLDEAHEVNLSGRHFRPEFRSATKFIGQLARRMKTPVPRIIMSATLRKSDEDTVVKLLGDMKPNHLLGPMSRRNIRIVLNISGNPANSIKTSAEQNFQVDAEHQALFFTHSKSNAEGALLAMAHGILERHREGNEDAPDSIATSFTGGDGIMLKTGVMDAVGLYEFLTGEGTVLDPTIAGDERGVVLPAQANDDDDPVLLPKIQILVGTSAIQAGISSKWFKHAYKKGFPATLYEFVQEMGRVDRLMDSLKGSNTLQILCNKDDDGIVLPAWIVDSSWDGINTF